MKMPDKNPSPLKAIRLKCLECAGGSRTELQQCQIDDCALHYYRFGTNPNRKKIGSVGNLDRGCQSTPPSQVGGETPTQLPDSAQE